MAAAFQLRFMTLAVDIIVNLAVAVADPRPSFHKNGRTSPNWTATCSITSQRLHHRVALNVAIDFPV